MNMILSIRPEDKQVGPRLNLRTLTSLGMASRKLTKYLGMWLGSISLQCCLRANNYFYLLCSLNAIYSSSFLPVQSFFVDLSGLTWNKSSQTVFKQLEFLTSLSWVWTPCYFCQAMFEHAFLDGSVIALASCRAVIELSHAELSVECSSLPWTWKGIVNMFKLGMATIQQCLRSVCQKLGLTSLTLYLSSQNFEVRYLARSKKRNSNLS